MTRMRGVAGVILAGGLGQRMGGVHKADLLVGGVSQLDRVASLLEGQVSPLLISARPGTRFKTPCTLPIVHDLGVNIGPVAGLAAIAAHLQSGKEPIGAFLTVAVDTPFFPANFLAKALVLFERGADAVVAQHQGQIYPTNTLWRLDALGALPRQVRQKRSPKGLRGILNTLDWQPLADWDGSQNPFANINTAGDLLDAQKRALRDTGGGSDRGFPDRKSGLGKSGQNS